MVHISYLLNNGKTVNREYLVTGDIFTQSGLESLILEDAMVFAHPLNNWLIEPENILHIILAQEGYTDIQVMNPRSNPLHMEGLLEAVRADYLQGLRHYCNRPHIADRPEPIEFTATLYTLTSHSRRNQTESINLYFYDHTLQWLSDNRYSRMQYY